jgi:hypothetical protein
VIALTMEATTLLAPVFLAALIAALCESGEYCLSVRRRVAHELADV